MRRKEGKEVVMAYFRHLPGKDENTKTSKSYDDW